MWQHLTRNILLVVLAFSVRILYKYNLLADDDYVLVFKNMHHAAGRLTLVGDFSVAARRWCRNLPSPFPKQQHNRKALDRIGVKNVFFISVTFLMFF